MMSFLYQSLKFLKNSPVAVWKLVVNTPWLLWLFTDHWAVLWLVRCRDTGLWLVNELGQVKIHFWLCPGSGATGLPVATTWGPRPAEIRHMVKTTSTLITYHSVAKGSFSAYWESVYIQIYLDPWPERDAVSKWHKTPFTEWDAAF